MHRKQMGRKWREIREMRMPPMMKEDHRGEINSQGRMMCLGGGGGALGDDDALTLGNFPSLPNEHVKPQDVQRFTKLPKNN